MRSKNFKMGFLLLFFVLAIGGIVFISGVLADVESFVSTDLDVNNGNQIVVPESFCSSCYVFISDEPNLCAECKKIFCTTCYASLDVTSCMNCDTKFCEACYGLLVTGEISCKNCEIEFFELTVLSDTAYEFNFVFVDGEGYSISEFDHEKGLYKFTTLAYGACAIGYQNLQHVPFSASGRLAYFALDQGYIDEFESRQIQIFINDIPLSEYEIHEVTGGNWFVRVYPDNDNIIPGNEDVLFCPKCFAAFDVAQGKCRECNIAGVSEIHLTCVNCSTECVWNWQGRNACPGCDTEFYKLDVRCDPGVCYDNLIRVNGKIYGVGGEYGDLSIFAFADVWMQTTEYDPDNVWECEAWIYWENYSGVTVIVNDCVLEGYFSYESGPSSRYLAVYSPENLGLIKDPPKASSPEDGSQDEGTGEEPVTTFTCPMCGYLSDEFHNTCPDCDVDLKICDSCDTVIEAESLKCSSCGKEFPNAVVPF